MSTCTKCRGTATPKHSKCQECLNKAKKIDKRKYIQRVTNGLCVKCGKTFNGKGTRCNKCVSKISDTQLRHRIKSRLEVMVHYCGGKPKCQCCGEDEVRFLEIDHINGGGRKQRTTLGGGGCNFYRWLKKHHYPKGFQVLCMSCNGGKARNGGVCPHKDKSSSRFHVSEDVLRALMV